MPASSADLARQNLELAEQAAADGAELGIAHQRAVLAPGKLAAKPEDVPRAFQAVDQRQREIADIDAEGVAHFAILPRCLGAGRGAELGQPAAARLAFALGRGDHRIEAAAQHLGERQDARHLAEIRHEVEAGENRLERGVALAFGHALQQRLSPLAHGAMHGLGEDAERRLVGAGDMIAEAALELEHVVAGHRLHALPPGGDDGAGNPPLGTLRLGAVGEEFLEGGAGEAAERRYAWRVALAKLRAERRQDGLCRQARLAQRALGLEAPRKRQGLAMRQLGEDQLELLGLFVGGHKPCLGSGRLPARFILPGVPRPRQRRFPGR